MRHVLSAFDQSHQVVGRATYLDLTDAHTAPRPPPETEPALPQDHSPDQVLQPVQPVLLDQDEIAGSRQQGEGNGSPAKDGSSSVEPPGSLTIDKQSPEKQRDGEDENEGRVKDVGHSVAKVDCGSI